jgi:hypothetical protein
MSLFGKKETKEQKIWPSFQFRVDNAYPGDHGCGKVRLDPESMLLLKVSPGDLVFIQGQRITVAKVWRSLMEHWNQHQIQIDNFTRANAGVNVGDLVTIRKVSHDVVAKSVVLAPPEDIPKDVDLTNNSDLFKALNEFPLITDDLVPIPVNYLLTYNPQIVEFQVVNVEPANAVITDNDTSFKISSEFFKKKKSENFDEKVKKWFSNKGWNNNLQFGDTDSWARITLVGQNSDYSCTIIWNSGDGSNPFLFEIVTHSLIKVPQEKREKIAKCLMVLNRERHFSHLLLDYDTGEIMSKSILFHKNESIFDEIVFQSILNVSVSGLDLAFPLITKLIYSDISVEDGFTDWIASLNK